MDQHGRSIEIQEAVLLPKWRLDSTFCSLWQKVLRERSAMRAQFHQEV